MAGDLVDQVRASVDLFSIASEITSLKKRGGRYFGRCPLHSEKTPSFSVLKERGLWYCFGCHRGGDAIELWKLHLGLGFTEAVRDLAAKLGLDAGVLPPLEQWWSWAQTKFSGSVAEAYARSRGYPKTVGVGFEPRAPRGLEGYQEIIRAAGLASRRGASVMRGRLVVPIRSGSGRLEGLCGRRLKEGGGPKDYLFTREGGSAGLYNLDVAKRASTSSIVVGEGVFDQWALEEAGALSSVASFGSGLSTYQLSSLAPWDEVVFAYDGDNAGREGVDRAARQLLRSRKRVLQVKMPEGRDPDDIFSAEGPDRLTDLLVSARDWIELKVKSLGGLPRRDAAREAREVLGHVADRAALEDYRTFAARQLGLPRRALATTSRRLDEEAEAPRERFPAGEIAAVRGMIEHVGGGAPQVPPYAVWTTGVGRAAAEEFSLGIRGQEIVARCLSKGADPAILARACCEAPGRQIDLERLFAHLTTRWARRELAALSGALEAAESDGDEQMKDYLREQRATVSGIARQVILD